MRHALYFYRYREDTLNTHLAVAPASLCKSKAVFKLLMLSQCAILPEELRYQFTASGGMESLVSLDGIRSDNRGISRFGGNFYRYCQTAGKRLMNLA